MGQIDLFMNYSYLMELCLKKYLSKIAQLAGAVEYTDCFSAEG